jgi:hypothetical protein
MNIIGEVYMVGRRQLQLKDTEYSSIHLKKLRKKLLKLTPPPPTSFDNLRQNFIVPKSLVTNMYIIVIWFGYMYMHFCYWSKINIMNIFKLLNVKQWRCLKYV